MKKVLIYGGTTEGRKIAEILAENNVESLVSVATEYGEQVIPENPLVKVMVGRLTASQMKNLVAENSFSAVIDATHPFATEVSKNIKESIANNLPLFRFERRTDCQKSKDFFYFENSAECAEALKNTAGNIFLTTGSKDLSVFCKDEKVRERLFVRVLPGMESLKLCYDSGLEGKQIIAMQGPFSRQMNEVQIQDYNISVLVTKESGKTGGLDTKLQAAKTQNIKCFVIKNPNSQKTAEEQENVCTTTYDLLKKLQKIGILTSIDRQNSRISVTLAGIGMGNPDTMTLAVKKSIKEADYIFGAERMLESISQNARAKKISAYLPKDIIPALEEIKNQSNGEEDIKITVLFSGDSGFFSGAEKLFAELKKLEYVSAAILPGISSVSYFASKIGINWENFRIISMHGTKNEQWQPQFKEALSQNAKIFMLTSGLEDVQEIWQQLKTLNSRHSLISGYRLSYSDENIVKITEENYTSLKNQGLYSLILLPEENQ